MLKEAAELPIVLNLNDITEVGFYRCRNEIIKQCSSTTPGEAMKEIYNEDGLFIGQAWSDSHGVLFRRNRGIGFQANVWGEWFIVEKDNG